MKKFFSMKIFSIKLKHIIIASLVAVLFPPFAQAQERLIGLHGNPTIEQFLQSRQNSDTPSKSREIMTISPLWLPFFDDFTYDGPYPDSLRWEDNFAFVNSLFQKNPANRGVATLDALNAEGKLYAHASHFPFVADHLTSRPIRTDSVYKNEKIQPLIPNDSLYLSFFYQPQGIGDAPERHDSLVLEFFWEHEQIELHLDSIYHPTDTIWFNEIDYEIIDAYYEYITDTLIIPEQWKSVWASHGMSIDDFYAIHGRWMAQVMILITDEAYFRPDFRFRFRNYASLPSHTLPGWQSNMDQWNIDYVYLNCDRFWFDTTYQDISFVNQGKSLLQNFTAMPYKQYVADPASVMKMQFTTTVTNLDNAPYNADYSCRIYDPNGNLVPYNYSNMDRTTIIYFNPILQNIDVTARDLLFNRQGTFTIKQTLINKDVEGGRLRDSITFLQEFENYFAYDDGVPKAGYGLSAPRSMLAVRFPLNAPDTLQAVDIFFNTTPIRQSEGHIEYFKLMVWQDRYGVPGDTLYTSDEKLCIGESETCNDRAGRFIRFPINRNVLVSSGFFVGVQQSTGENINIGFDYSNNMRNNNLYKIYNDPWQTSVYEGSIMIRPVMGTPALAAPPAEHPTAKSIAVFPNPLTSKQQIYIQKPDSFDDDHTVTLKIYDGVGKQCYESPYTKPEVTLNNLYNGMFIIKLYNHTTGETASTKLLITR
ncbi:MAG: hypothetical protein FWF09_02070 [Bacteroidales bacterium]|nr:hypothetical protein [Bacteroidales bacterium]